MSKGGVGKLLSVAAPIALGLAFPGVGTALGTALGATEGAGAATLGDALIGAGAGAAGGAVGGGGVKGALRGAALGGVGGAVAPNLSDIIDGAGNALGLSGSTGVGDTLDSAAAGTALPPEVASNTPSGSISAGSGAAGAAGANLGGGVSADFANALGVPQLDTSGIDKLAAQATSMADTAGSSAGTAAASSVAGASPEASKGLLGFLKSNSNLLLPTAAIGSAALEGNKQSAAEKTLASQASSTNAIGSQLANTVNSGQLPAGAESMVQQAVSDGTAAIQSKYAQMGLSGSTMETQEIQALNERAQSMRFQMASDLTSTGLTALNSSSAIYQQLMNQQLQQDQALSNSISGLAEASALGSALKGA